MAVATVEGAGEVLGLGVAVTFGAVDVVGAWLAGDGGAVATGAANPGAAPMLAAKAVATTRDDTAMANLFDFMSSYC